MIIIKSRDEIEKIRESSRIVAEVLQTLREFIRPGITTWALNKKAEEVIKKRKARAAFKGYKPSFGSGAYPAALCVSINEEVIHGIPSTRRVIKEGDIVSMDVGVCYKGYYGDGATTVAVGEVEDRVKELLKVAEEALYRGIEAARVGNRVGDISFAVQSYVESHGFSVIREFVGHGVGKRIHEEPPVPNFGEPGRGPLLKEGMTIAIEPMVAVGSGEVRIKEDGWTAVTVDGSWAAHFEHTIAVLEEGPRILTEL
ncbi:MAG: type I methionyl aminopeptidase [Aquificota bacterium]|nr:MAG: type I methionyl aminopeptidase [Aquificota bacterium]